MDIMEFKVKGITFENENEKDIQKLIRKELKEQFELGLIGEKWEGYTNSEIKEMDLEVWEYSDVEFYVKVKEDVFEGKKCVKVYIENNNGDYIHVGYIPKKQLKEYEEKNKNAIEVKGIGKLTGGKLRKCEWIEEDYEEKAVVETVDLDYGITVNLDFFYENEEKIKTQIKNNTSEEDFDIARTYVKLEEDDERVNHKEIEKIKSKIRTVFISCSIILAISFFIMPLGIIFLVISIIGFKWGFKQLKEYNIETLT